MIAFSIPGNPVPKGRPRFGGGRAYTPNRTKAYESKVRMLALQARQECRQRPLRGDVSVVIDICGYKRADIDNISKSILDACNGVLYLDDRQIQRLVASRIDADEARVDVTVEDISK